MTTCRQPQKGWWKEGCIFIAPKSSVTVREPPSFHMSDFNFGDISGHFSSFEYCHTHFDHNISWIIHSSKKQKTKPSIEMNCHLNLVLDPSECLKTMPRGWHMTQWAHSENRQNRCRSNRQCRMGSTSAPQWWLTHQEMKEASERGRWFREIKLSRVSFSRT